MEPASKKQRTKNDKDQPSEKSKNDDNRDREQEETVVKAIEGEFSHVAHDKPLWLEIVRYLDSEDLKNIDDMPELKGMGLLVEAERQTVKQLKYIKWMSERANPAGAKDPIGLLDVGYDFTDDQSLVSQVVGYDTYDQSLVSQVESKREFWYSWGADKAGFRSRKLFKDFCKYAGVDPSVCILWGEIFSEDNSWNHNSYHFLSTDKKVIFTCSRDPNHKGAYAHYFGMTGKRERVKWLLKWFKDNGYSEERCYGGRGFG